MYINESLRTIKTNKTQGTSVPTRWLGVNDAIPRYLISEAIK